MLYTLIILSIMNSQSKIEIPKEYKLQTIPKYNSEEYRKLNFSEDISIELTEKNTITTFKTPRKKASELNFNNGLLIGTDHGEWGGKLSFKTEEKEIKIKDGNIFSVFEFKGDIYFIQGLAHGSINYGEIYKL